MSTYGIWLSAAGMKVNEHRQHILANNMANANTVGFKQDLAIIQQRPVESLSTPEGFEYQHPVMDGLAGGVDIRPSQYNFEQGHIERTGRPLDIAVDGEGFLMVGDDKDKRYTRNGKMTINTDGYLVLTAGAGRWKVLDDVESPIQIDKRQGDITISSNGTITQGENLVGTLGLHTTDNKQALRKTGETLFDAGKAKMKEADGRFHVGAIERSNFDIMKGLASMIEASRSYEMNANLIRLQDQATAQAVNTVGKLA